MADRIGSSRENGCIPTFFFSLQSGVTVFLPNQRGPDREGDVGIPECARGLTQKRCGKMGVGMLLCGSDRKSQERRRVRSGEDAEEVIKTPRIRRATSGGALWVFLKREAWCGSSARVSMKCLVG